MKTRVIAGLAVMAVLLAAFATMAFAASDHTSTGTLKSFSFDTAKKTGVLTVKGKHRFHFRVTKDTNCGVSYGQSGDQIACKSLGRKKYDGKPVRVTWQKVNGEREASLVAVDLS
jgi:hypothetical protein